MTPEEESGKFPVSGSGNGLLKTITDGLEEEESENIPQKNSVKLVDKPELISTDLPSAYIDSG